MLGQGWNIISVPIYLHRYISNHPKRKCLKFENLNCCVLLDREIELKNYNFTTEIRAVKTKGITQQQKTDLKNFLCLIFNENTTYENIHDFLKGRNITLIRDDTLYVPQETKKEETKTDINSANEEELKALPGINIILTKKIIKRREEIGGFESLSDFLNFIRVSPKIQSRLLKTICVQPYKGNKKIQKKEEREIDF
ncbi:helix-hairpin-helix domain-containing protein [bacterium]|nr:helix-hairpin-helix domain-containing protein [bacterium]